MAEKQVPLSEAKTIKHLSNEKWISSGRLLVSRDNFSDAAAEQYLTALTQETRDLLRIRTQTGSSLGGPEGGKKLILDKHAAIAFFAETKLDITSSPEHGIC